MALAGAVRPGLTVVAAGPSPGCVVDTTGLLGWWRGQETPAAAVGPDLVGTPAYTDAVVRRGFTLDPARSLAAADLPVVASGLTVVAWVRPDPATAMAGVVQTLLSRWDDPTDGDSSRSFSLALDPFGVLVWATDEVSSRRPLELRVPAAALLDGDWHHLAATWSPTEVAVAIDGVVVATAASQGGTLEPAPHVPFRVGGKGGLGPSFAYTGGIDEPAVFSRALTAAEIAALANAGADGMCTPPSTRVRIANPTPADGDGFGYRTAIDGGTVAVGASADLAGVDSGSVVVLTRGSTGWTSAPAFAAADTSAGDAFGDAVALDGDTLVVGAPFEDQRGAGAGAAYVFVRGPSGWVQQAKLLGADTTMSDGFGSAVDVDGDTIVVGAPGADDATGSVYVFRRNGATWTQQTEIRPADAQPLDLFGVSVSLQGDLVAVGMPNDTIPGADPPATEVAFAGSVRIFRRAPVGPAWSLQHVLRDPTPVTGDLFGWSVSLHDRRVLVGAQRTDSAAGVAHVFRETETESGWVRDAELRALDPEGGDLFGISVALGSDTAVIGAVWDDDNGSFSGTVWTFRRTGESWARVGRPITDSVAGDRTGASVAIDADTLVAGSPGAVVAGAGGAGGVGVGGAGAVDIVTAP